MIIFYSLKAVHYVTVFMIGIIGYAESQLCLGTKKIPKQHSHKSVLINLFCTWTMCK